jgi:hypothetical protein
MTGFDGPSTGASTSIAVATLTSRLALADAAAANDGLPRFSPGSRPTARSRSMARTCFSVLLRRDAFLAAYFASFHGLGACANDHSSASEGPPFAGSSAGLGKPFGAMRAS